MDPATILALLGATVDIYAKVRAIAASTPGVTPEQLAALDAKLNDAIARRHQEHNLPV